MYSLKLYKYRDSYVLYTPTVQLFSYLLHTHTLLVQTHKHDVSAPCYELYISRKCCRETEERKYTLSLCVSNKYIRGVNYCQEIDIFKKP